MIEYQSADMSPRVPFMQRVPFSPVWWMLLAIIVLGMLGGGTALLFGHVGFGTLALAAVVGVVVMAGNARRAVRRRQVKMLLAYVDQAVQLRLPIAEMLAAATASESPGAARRLIYLRAALESGESLADALLAATPYVPLRTRSLIAAAERQGNLPETLRRLLDESPGDDQRGLWSDFGLFGVYVLMMLFAMGATIWVTQVFVWPKYFYIFRDFNIEPPGIVRILEWYGPSVGSIVSSVSACILIALVGRSLRQLLSPARPRKSKLVGLRDAILWRLPVLGGMARSGGMGDAFSAIATSLESGVVLDRAVLDAAYPYLNRVLQTRLGRWSLGLSQGQPIEQAAVAAEMPALVAGLCGSGVRAGDLPATMRFLARHYRSQFSRTAELLHAAAAPVVAAVGGAVVLIMWAAMYGPMLSLIDSLAVRSRLW